jgi:hypothetical protein
MLCVSFSPSFSLSLANSTCIFRSFDTSLFTLLSASLSIHSLSTSSIRFLSQLSPSIYQLSLCHLFVSFTLVLSLSPTFLLSCSFHQCISISFSLTFLLHNFLPTFLSVGLHHSEPSFPISPFSPFCIVRNLSFSHFFPFFSFPFFPLFFSLSPSFSHHFSHFKLIFVIFLYLLQSRNFSC